MDKKNYFGFLTVILKKYKERKLIKMVKDDWSLLCYISEEDQTDSVIDAAMDEDIDAFRYIIDDNKKTHERCVKAVSGCWLFLDDVPDQMQTDEIIDLAMWENPRAIRFIKDEKMKTLYRCLKAVSGDCELIKYVPEELKERVKKELGL